MAARERAMMRQFFACTLAVPMRLSHSSIAFWYGVSGVPSGLKEMGGWFSSLGDIVNFLVFSNCYLSLKTS